MAGNVKAPPVKLQGGRVLLGGGTGAADNAVQYTSPDVSWANYHAIEAVTTACDVYVTLDGTNWNAKPCFLSPIHSDPVLAADENEVTIAEIWILRGKFANIRVLQKGAGGSSACRVLHGVE